MSSRQRARKLADRITKASSDVVERSSKCEELRLEMEKLKATMAPLDPASTEWAELARQQVSATSRLTLAESALAQARKTQRRLETDDSGSGHGSSSSAEEVGSGSEE